MFRTVSLHYKEWLYKIKYLQHLVFIYKNINLFILLCCNTSQNGNYSSCSVSLLFIEVYIRS